MDPHRFTVETDARLTTVDVTDRVHEAVPEGYTGTVTVFVRHTTAAVVLQEAESRLRRDIEGFLARIVPEADYEHDEIDDNADSHLRATLLGPEVTVPVTEGTPDLGTWQSVLLVECDGPRRRTVVVG